MACPTQYITGYSFHLEKNLLEYAVLTGEASSHHGTSTDATTCGSGEPGALDVSSGPSQAPHNPSKIDLRRPVVSLSESDSPRS